MERIANPGPDLTSVPPKGKLRLAYKYGQHSGATANKRTRLKAWCVLVDKFSVGRSSWSVRAGVEDIWKRCTFETTEQQDTDEPKALVHSRIYASNCGEKA